MSDEKNPNVPLLLCTMAEMGNIFQLKERAL